MIDSSKYRDAAAVQKAVQDAPQTAQLVMNRASPQYAELFQLMTGDLEAVKAAAGALATPEETAAARLTSIDAEIKTLTDANTEIQKNMKAQVAAINVGLKSTVDSITADQQSPTHRPPLSWRAPIPSARPGPTPAAAVRRTASHRRSRRGTLVDRLTGDYRFGETGFYWAFGTFDSRASYITIRALFVEKYGEPTSRRRKDITTVGGATLEGEDLEWRGEKVVIRLSRFAGTITDGSFEAITRAADDASAERVKAQQQKGKSNL